MQVIRLSAILFSGTLSRQSLLQSALLARLQVVGVTPHFLNDVFRLNLALESAEGTFDALTFLKSNFCHDDTPDDKFQHNEATPLQGYQMAPVVGQKQQFNALDQNGQQRCTRNARRM